MKILGVENRSGDALSSAVGEPPVPGDKIWARAAAAQKVKAAGLASASQEGGGQGPGVHSCSV